jgi:hypothetical protein
MELLIITFLIFFSVAALVLSFGSLRTARLVRSRLARLADGSATQIEASDELGVLDHSRAAGWRGCSPCCGQGPDSASGAPDPPAADPRRLPARVGGGDLHGPAHRAGPGAAGAVPAHPRSGT